MQSFFSHAYESRLSLLCLLVWMSAALLAYSSVHRLQSKALASNSEVMTIWWNTNWLICSCALFVFLTPELMDQDRLDGRLSFLCHQWGPWLNSRKIYKIPPPFPIFTRGQKVPNVDPNFDTTPVWSAAIRNWRTFLEI